MRKESRYCAFCGHQHRIYTKSHVGIFDVLISLALGLLVLAPFSDGLDARGIGLAGIFIGVAELFTVIRHRMSLSCGRCGFDPIVYRRSQEDAAKLVRTHLARRAEDPRTFLAEPVGAYGKKRDKKRDKAHAQKPANRSRSGRRSEWNPEA